MKVTKGAGPAAFSSARTRDHDHMIIRIEAEFIGSGCPANADKLAGAQEIVIWIFGIEYPDFPRAVSDPKLLVIVGGQHAVRTGNVIVWRRG